MLPALFQAPGVKERERAERKQKEPGFCAGCVALLFFSLLDLLCMCVCALCVYCALKIMRIARCAVKNLRRSVEEEGTKRRTKARRSKAHAQTPREMGSGFSSLTYPAKNRLAAR